MKKRANFKCGILSHWSELFLYCLSSSWLLHSYLCDVKSVLVIETWSVSEYSQWERNLVGIKTTTKLLDCSQWHKFLLKSRVFLTLVCLINVLHALFNFGQTSTLHDLIWPCKFIDFWTFFRSVWKWNFKLSFKAAAYLKIAVFIDLICLNL